MYLNRIKNARFYTPEEEQLLRNLTAQYLGQYELLKSTKSNWESKKQVWIKIANVFNSTANTNRSVESLKSKHQLLRKSYLLNNPKQEDIKDVKPFKVTKPKVLIIKDEQLPNLKLPLVRKIEPQGGAPIGFFKTEGFKPIGAMEIDSIQGGLNNELPSSSGEPVQVPTQVEHHVTADGNEEPLPGIEGNVEMPNPLEMKPLESKPNLGMLQPCIEETKPNLGKPSIKTEETKPSITELESIMDEVKPFLDDYEPSCKKLKLCNDKKYSSIADRIAKLLDAKTLRNHLKIQISMEKDIRKKARDEVKLQNLKLRQQLLERRLALSS